MQETILAKIGDRVITAKEFIQRSEYAIRPAWCRNDDYIHRKVALNSLVAEKLFALEGKKAATAWIGQAPVKNYLKGRKEQEMRQLHYSKTALENVVLKPDERNLVSRLAERTYNVQIIPINNDALAARISDDLQKGVTTFDALLDEFHAATGQVVEEQLIGFEAPLDDVLFKQLFLNPLNKGQVVGPVHGERDQNFLIRVNGWSRRPIISEAETKQREADIAEKLTNIQARDIYESWVKELMRGKQLTFDETIFRKVTEAVGQDYFRSPEERKMIFKQKLWNEDTGDPQMIIDDIRTQLDEISGKTLFEFDGERWSVKQFEEYLEIHPLVFRNRKMSKGQFALEFRNAIADMIRDKKITEDAYAKNMDQEPRVVHRMQMWEDNLVALYERNHLLDSTGADSLGQMQIVERFLDPRVEELLRLYQAKIEINTDMFEKIKLTSVDMFVLQDNMPFPVVVPQFPALTTYNKLDYGHRLTRE